jgi:hypothetical protein
VLHSCHLPATFGAGSAGRDTVVHVADLLAIQRAGFADFSANLTNTMLEMRAAQLEIGRGLADLGAVHQESEMRCQDVFPAGLKAVVHRGLQTDLMAVAASINTGLHGVFGHFGAFGMGWVIHGILYLFIVKAGKREVGESSRLITVLRVRLGQTLGIL